VGRGPGVFVSWPWPNGGGAAFWGAPMGPRIWAAASKLLLPVFFLEPSLHCVPSTSQPRTPQRCIPAPSRHLASTPPTRGRSARRDCSDMQAAGLLDKAKLQKLMALGATHSRSHSHSHSAFSEAPLLTHSRAVTVLKNDNQLCRVGQLRLYLGSLGVRPVEAPCLRPRQLAVAFSCLLQPPDALAPPSASQAAYNVEAQVRRAPQQLEGREAACPGAQRVGGPARSVRVSPLPHHLTLSHPRPRWASHTSSPSASNPPLSAQASADLASTSPTHPPPPPSSGLTSTPA